MDEIKLKLREFANKRNWNQFHNPKNLAMALGGEESLRYLIPPTLYHFIY